MALASPEDVAGVLGRSLTEEEGPRVDHLLKLLSEKFCKEAKSRFVIETFTHRVKVNGGHARPRRTPLLDVLSVVDDDGVPVPYRQRHGYVAVDLPSDRFVVMTYRAGYEQVPAAVVEQIVDSVLRVLRIDPQAASGATQSTQTAGPFSTNRSFAAWAVGGQTTLSPDDIALARTYRPKRAGNVWVGGSR